MLGVNVGGDRSGEVRASKGSRTASVRWMTEGPQAGMSAKSTLATLPIPSTCAQGSRNFEPCFMLPKGTDSAL